MSNGDDDSSKKFEYFKCWLWNENVFGNDCESKLFDSYQQLPSSDFFSNSDDTYCNNNENNKSKMISVKPQSSNSQKQSENSLNSSSNSISNKSKQNLNIINNKIIETKNNNKEDKINIDEKKDNKINANRERKGKQSIKFEIENGKTNDQTNGQINNQANSNSISVPKNGKISYNYPERIHDKNAADNQIKKMNTFLINAVLIVQSNKIIKIYQASKSPESNSLEKNEFVKINVSITSNTSVEFNQNLLFTTLKEILSFPISNKIKKYNEEHNKQITEKYYKECPIFKQFCDLYYGDIINLINDEDNSFEGLFDTYKEELEKRQDKEDIEKIIKNFPEVVKCRKKRKISP